MQPMNQGMPLGDVMESLKIERDKLMHECGQYKQQCDDFERKLHSQLIEISTLHKSIKDLEHRHVKLKLQYEEDLHRLQTISHPRSQTFGEATTAVSPHTNRLIFFSQANEWNRTSFLL